MHIAELAEGAERARSDRPGSPPRLRRLDPDRHSSPNFSYFARFGDFRTRTLAALAESFPDLNDRRVDRERTEMMHIEQQY